MGNPFKLTTDRYPPASLGCGTVVIIAFVVLIVSSAGSQKTTEELTRLRQEVEALKASVDAQTDEIRGLKELIKFEPETEAPARRGGVLRH